MVRDYSFVNKALFPAPPSSYEQHDFPLIWLRTQERDGDDVCLALHQLAQPDSSRPIVLYCHGNGEDIGQSYSMFRRRMRDWDAHVAAVEYPGYGVCRGSPSETSVKRAVVSAVSFIETELGFPPSNIVLFGRSIGTGPATFVAAEYARLGKPIGGLILQSPYLSIKSLCRSLVGFLANFVLERFNNREEITHYHGPLLVIHGVQDQLIPCQHGEYLHNTCPSPPELKRLLLAEGADHNVFDDINHVQIPVREFLIDMVEPRLAPTPITFSVPPERYQQTERKTEERGGIASWFSSAGTTTASVACSLFEASGGAVVSTVADSSVRVDAANPPPPVTTTTTTTTTAVPTATSSSSSASL